MVSKQVIGYVAAASVAAFVGSYLSWSSGFDAGADSFACVQAVAIDKHPIEKVEACGRVNTKSIFFSIRTMHMKAVDPVSVEQSVDNEYTPI